MVCSTCLLYVLRRLKIISFTNSEPSVPSDSLFFVPFRILLRTSPLSLSYLLYMVCLFPRTQLQPWAANMEIVAVYFEFWVMLTFHDGLLKASFNGICAWSKCSYVYNSKAHNSSIYNDNGVFLGKAETHPTYNWQVNVQACYFTLHLYSQNWSTCAS